MFTGIITDIGKIKSISGKNDLRVEIETSYDLETIAIGASIACSGVCLTVVEKGKGSFAVDISAETINKTTVGSWKQNDKINLERALKMGDELGGHMVTGHVDFTAKVKDISDVGESKRFIFTVPEQFSRFFAQKGSATVNGVSLTVNEVSNDSFSVNIIPHTLEKTTFYLLNLGDVVNIEIDVLMRYLDRLRG